MNYWSQADAGNAILWLRRTNLLVPRRYVHAGAKSLLFLCTQHGSRLISHSNISVGEWKNGRDALLGPLLFFATRCRRRKPWHGRRGKCDIFCAVIPLYLQIDALSEIVRRRRNECAPVTQRHTTGTSGDLCLAAAGSLWEHRKLFMLFKYREGVWLSATK